MALQPLSPENPLIVQLFHEAIHSIGNAIRKPQLVSPLPVGTAHAQMPQQPAQQTTYPGQKEWAAMMQKQDPSQQASYYENAYRQAVTSKDFSGKYYNPHPTAAVSPTQAPQQPVPTGAFADFTTTPVPSQYQTLIDQSAQQNGIPPSILASLLFSEHGFQATGKSYNRDKSGNVIPGNYDRGIAQINSMAHPEVTDQQANDPTFAIPWAAKTLSGHIKNLGMQKGIVAYNTGEGGAQAAGDPKQHPYYKKVTSGLSPTLRSKFGL